MSIEANLGVRSSVYFSSRKRPSRRSLTEELLRPRDRPVGTCGYDIMHPTIVETMGQLNAGGWEIGLQPSPDCHTDQAQLAREKDRLEMILGSKVTGGRQPTSNTGRTELWRHYKRVGLEYGVSRRTPEQPGVENGDDVFRPFEDHFAVFPVTIRGNILLQNRDLEEAWTVCESLLEEAAGENAVFVVLWAQRYFNENRFPAHSQLYSRLIRAAKERGARIGPLGDLCKHMSQAATDAIQVYHDDATETPDVI